MFSIKSIAQISMENSVNILCNLNPTIISQYWQKHFPMACILKNDTLLLNNNQMRTPPSVILDKKWNAYSITTFNWRKKKATPQQTHIISKYVVAVWNSDQIANL